MCGKGFSGTSALRGHYVTVHNVTGMLEVCPVCKKKFTRKDNMKAHIRKKHPETLTPTSKAETVTNTASTSAASVTMEESGMVAMLESQSMLGLDESEIQSVGGAVVTESIPQTLPGMEGRGNNNDEIEFSYDFDYEPPNSNA